VGKRRPPGAHDIAAEVIRRAKDDDDRDRYVVRLSDPPTPQERLQLLAARLQRRPIAIMPHKCATMDEWTARYGWLKDH
jgi:hypothetical protein